MAVPPGAELWGRGYRANGGRVVLVCGASVILGEWYAEGVLDGTSGYGHRGVWGLRARGALFVSPTKGWVYGFLDPLDEWLSEDKWTHFGWAAAVYAHGWAYGGGRRGWVEVLVGALLVELVEVIRYQAWANDGFSDWPHTWPWLTDKVSPKDLMVAVLGALCMVWLLP